MQYYLHIISLVTIAFLPHAGISSILYKKNIVSGCIISMLLLASIVSPIAYMNAMFIKPIVFIYSFIGYFLLFKNSKLIFKFNKNEISFFLIFSLFFLWYFRSLSPELYIFSDHDLLYFSWIGEFINPSIQGPLKLDISWPNQMASNHLIPGGIIAILSTLLEKQTLVSSIAVRYILISLYFSYFFSQWAIIKKINPYKFLILLILCMSIFGQEIGYEIRISSFIYVILILEILKNLFITPNKKILLSLSLFLIIAKAPIFFIGIILSLWIVYLNKEKISSLNWWIALLVSLNFTSWFLAPPPKEHGGLPFIVNIFIKEDLLSLNGLKGWFITDTFSEVIFNFLEGPFIVFALLIYILTKYYLPYFLITKKILRDQTKIILLDAWVLMSILTWAFVRYPIGIGHTAHLYILMSLITLFFVLKYITESKNSYAIILLSFLAIFYGYPDRLLNPLYYVENELSRIPESTMRNSELKNGYLEDKDNENYAVKNQIRSAMIGEKLFAKLTRPTQKSVMYNWIIQNDSK